MKITKAILTGGGRATRLRPITTTINKHLIPLANKPMIFQAIEKAIDAGIREIFININPGETQLQEAVGDGSRWGIRITYFEQTGGPQGIAHVVKCAQQFVAGEPFMFYLSDNIILGSLRKFVSRFDAEQLDCLLAFATVPDPERFGVPVFDSRGKLADVLEKPADPPSNFAVTGIYLFSPKFFEAFDHIQKSDRGEYEIPSIISYLLKNSGSVSYEEITGWWKDTGKPGDLLQANRLLLDEMRPEQFALECACLADTKKEGNISAGRNTVFGKNVQIQGPVIIGDNCFLENCSVGPHVTVGSNATIKNATVQDSIIFDDCKITAALKIKESLIGKNAAIIAHYEGEFHRVVVGDNTTIEL